MVRHNLKRDDVVNMLNGTGMLGDDIMLSLKLYLDEVEDLVKEALGKIEDAEDVDDVEEAIENLSEAADKLY